MVKWLLDSWVVLKEKFVFENFDFVSACKVLGKDKETSAVVLSRPRRLGLVEAGFDVVDHRKRVYHLVKPAKFQFRCKSCGKRSWFKPEIVGGRFFVKCPKCLCEGDYKFRRGVY